MALLEIRDLTINFGGLRAVAGFNLFLETGDLKGLIGPNGAGKTTVFNMLTGVYRPDTGRVALEDKSLIGLKPHQITSLGLSRTFQNIRLFKGLSVLDNVRIALHLGARCSVAEAVFRLPRYYAEEKRIADRAIELLSVFRLDDRKDAIASGLPYGEQRRLEIARALATNPKVLLLDEPAAGMNPQESQELMSLIKWINKEFNLTILLIEHHMEVVMGVCQRITVLDYGVTIAEGSPGEIKRNPRVIEAYLGEEVRDAGD
ncbi:MAG: ABC transporter ATP-binding protein [Firmicutes bacterium]|nr:ABC transporter ATP-binding protein [Bacillota bacterium]